MQIFLEDSNACCKHHVVPELLALNMSSDLVRSGSVSQQDPSFIIDGTLSLPKPEGLVTGTYVHMMSSGLRLNSTRPLGAYS